MATNRKLKPARKLAIPDKKTASSRASQLRENALSRWVNEGGSYTHLPPQNFNSAKVQSEAPHFTNLELEQLRVRVIALENLVIALLAEGSDRQRELGREMATYISPRPGCTPHHMTLGAAAQMIHIIERADHFDALKESDVS